MGFLSIQLCQALLALGHLSSVADARWPRSQRPALIATAARGATRRRSLNAVFHVDSSIHDLRSVEMRVCWVHSVFWLQPWFLGIWRHWRRPVGAGKQKNSHLQADAPAAEPID